MGALAIFYLVASAFALAIACCGPNPLAKLVAAYLFASCLLCNAFNISLPVFAASERFSYLDVAAVMVLHIAWLRWRSVWLHLIIAALWAQIVFHFAFLARDWTGLQAWPYYFALNRLFEIQLVTVMGPTFIRGRNRASSVIRTKWVRRRRPPQLRLVA